MTLGRSVYCISFRPEFESLICITEMRDVRSGVHEVQRQEDHCGLLVASLAPG